jgi:hypothetical protein
VDWKSFLISAEQTKNKKGQKGKSTLAADNFYAFVLFIISSEVDFRFITITGGDANS